MIRICIAFKYVCEEELWYITVMSLQRRLYRLKDDPKIWLVLINKRFAEEISQQLDSARCVPTGDGMILVRHVHALLVFRNIDKDGP